MCDILNNVPKKGTVKKDQPKFGIGLETFLNEGELI